jgi:pSer/pThr/pTyr-binding forkhead associated (FHA) protein
VKPTTADAWSHACGVAGPLTVLVTGPGENDRRKVSIERGSVVVGRHPRSCVVLDDPRISDRHLYLQILGGQLYAIDLGSKTGVFRGLTRFSTGWVAPRNFFRLGPYHVSVDFRPASVVPACIPEDPIDHPSTDPAAFPRLRADVLVGNVRHSRWKMTRRLVLVGRDPSARLRLRDRSVSRFHAVLVGTPTGVWVVDLLSREGTWINGTRVPFARLVRGDRLRLGCYDFYLQTEEPAAPPALPAPAPLPGAHALSLPATPSVPALTPEGSALLPILQQFGQFQQQMLDQFQQSLMLMLQTFAKVNGDQMGLIREELAELRRLTEELHLARQQLGPAAAAHVESRTSFGESGTSLEGPTSVRLPAPAPAPMIPAPAPLPAPTIPPAPALAPDPEVHVWLSRQIASLESRREGVMKRILRKITGG